MQSFLLNSGNMFEIPRIISSRTRTQAQISDLCTRAVAQEREPSVNLEHLSCWTPSSKQCQVPCARSEKQPEWHWTLKTFMEYQCAENVTNSCLCTAGKEGWLAEGLYPKSHLASVDMK